MTDFVCVNVGKKYPKSYTEKLYNMVKRNTTVPFKFYVITDQVTLYPEPHFHAVEPIVDDIGWWCKLQMYSKELLPPGEYLYMDLDVVIVDNIDCFFEHSDFGILRDFIRPDEGLLPGKEYNSSIVKFDNRRTDGIWQYYQQNKKQWLNHQKEIHFFGDQNVVSSYLNHYPDFVTPFPDRWAWSFKKGWERGKWAGKRRGEFIGNTIPKQGKVCVFHGDPNPTQVIDQYEWIQKHYQ